LETNNTPKKPVAPKTPGTATPKAPTAPRKTASAPKAPATARATTAKAPATPKTASATKAKTATTAKASAPKATAPKTATPKATAPKTATPKATAPKTATPKATTTEPKVAPKPASASAPATTPVQPKVKPSVKKTPTQATASMNKEEALQSMSSHGSFTEADKKLLENHYQSNANIAKAKKKVKKPKIYQENAGLKGAKNVAGSNFFGNSASKIQGAKARAKASSNKGFKKPKKKRNSILSIIIVAVIFVALAVGTYFVVSNMNQDTGHITATDINIEQQIDSTQEIFSTPVTNYSFGDTIDRGLKLSNSADKIGVYVAFKMEVKEVVGNQRLEIDINANPNLAGGINNWTTATLNDGTVYYYYNGILEADESRALFSSYTLLTDSLNTAVMSGRTVEVTVTINVLQEGASFSSADTMWQQAPSTWKNQF